MLTQKRTSSSETFDLNSRKLNGRDLHKYVWGSIGILLIFLATFPLACWRVAQSDKFENQPFKSLTLDGNQKDNLAYPIKK